MKKLAFLSTDNLEDFFVYDEMLVPVFEQAGWQVDTVSWHAYKQVNWQQYAMVIVRSTWDYQQHAQAFITCLESIARQTRLENPLELQRWNLDKRYLQDLEGAGIPVIPTYWQEVFSLSDMQAQFDAFNTETLVIKPTVSANADDTFKLTRNDLQQSTATLQKIFACRRHMIQPFMPAISEEGEYSLFYFGGELSHTILKTPAEADFRVQEEHGGSMARVEAQPEMRMIGDATLAALPHQALYARLDLVRHNNSWAVMEVELIEPSLYFTLDAESPGKFVDAVLTTLGE